MAKKLIVARYATEPLADFDTACYLPSGGEAWVGLKINKGKNSGEERKEMEKKIML